MFSILAWSNWMQVPHHVSTMYSAATMWTACSVSTIRVLDCPQIISLVLPSDSPHLAGADKAPSKWPGGHNCTTEVNGRDRPLCPSKCNFRLSLQCCHFPGSGMLWINLKNMEWEIAQACCEDWHSSWPLFLTHCQNIHEDWMQLQNSTVHGVSVMIVLFCKRIGLRWTLMCFIE